MPQLVVRQWLRIVSVQEEVLLLAGSLEMHCKFVLTLLTGLVECMCFAGVTFGWASLVFVLKKEKYFEDLCPDAANHTTNSTDSCLPQDEHLSLIFTVAAFMNNLMTLPSGYVFDRFGTMVTRFIGILSYTTATLFITLSTAACFYSEIVRHHQTFVLTQCVVLKMLVLMPKPQCIRLLKLVYGLK
ncbi:PREDICTED: solute carrier family 43 member 3-like [Nanorana parkeri]|uniref:solute carrier family 43 member 3-like n=1 Tax=Nanorana parkeri TaxID=125878 RepID=UPI00085437C9|nr:PREDICTED: solute carrier family 43 member 3-like [Nanorana parkeri]